VISASAFKSSVSRAAPPSDLPAPLEALWWAAKGDWDRAHKIVQEDGGPAAAWVHAYLHRVEGDFSNAQYWYQRATQPVARGAVETEWLNIVEALLADRSET
jgi:hypothetical protein